MENSQKEKFIDIVQQIIRTELKNLGLMTGQWHLGKVDTVVNQKMLKVFVDGDTVSQQIPCNPDVTFSSGDFVFVLYVNSDSKNKFVPFKRGI